MEPDESRSQLLSRLPDADLMRRIAEDRDGAAFAIVYEREFPLLLRIAAHLVSLNKGALYKEEPNEAVQDLEVANEAVQDTFLRFWQDAATFDAARFVASGIPPDRALGHWLRLILKREVWKKVRERRFEARPKEPFHYGTQYDLADIEEAGLRHERRSEEIEDLLETVQQALTRIPPSYREVLETFYFKDVAVEEAAAILGISVGAMKGRLHRAITALRKAVRREGTR